ncbi:MAG: DedA family protein [Bacteroidetes bacterium]|nr:DedA family protein [Bacteroidota bacterium]HET6243341.1 DedA family protein [Bacteroidia bacterium]
MEFFYEYGLWGLFFASFFAATLLPFGSEGVLAIMIATGFDLYTCLWVATAGNWLGGMSCYFLGFIGKWEWIEKVLKIKPEKIKSIKVKLDKYGSLMGLFTWLPIIGDPLAVGLGLMRSNLALVSIFMFVGKFLRYIVLAYATDLAV